MGVQFRTVRTDGPIGRTQRWGSRNTELDVVSAAELRRRRQADEAAEREAREEAAEEQRAEARIAERKRIAKIMPLLHWQSIRKEVVEKYGITVNDIQGQSRKKLFCLARHELCYRLAAETSMSLPDIGRRIRPKYDHTSVLNGIAKHALRNRLPIIRRSQGWAGKPGIRKAATA